MPQTAFPPSLCTEWVENYGYTDVGGEVGGRVGR
jgi:hypothetical protein